MATFRTTEQTFEVIDNAYREQREHMGKPLDRRTSSIARAVIVKGLPQAEVARRNDVTKQWVSQVVNKYYQIYLATGTSVEVEAELWGTRTLEMPGVLAAPLNRFLSLAKSCKDPKALQQALTAVIRTLGAQSDKLE